jgi:hypothetical protein
LHATDHLHIPPYKRGFGNDIWSETSAVDKKVLYYLNRYCYRCHSSVRYSVFDRAAVKSRIGVISERVKMVNKVDEAEWMPQDRNIPGLSLGPLDPQTGTPTPVTEGELAEFLQLLNQL